jgi:hypothetical protein
MSILNSQKQYLAIVLFIIYIIFIAGYIRFFFTSITGLWLFADNIFFFLKFDKIPNFGGSLVFNSIISFVYNILIEGVFIYFFGNDIFGRLLNIKYEETKNQKLKLYLKTVLKYFILLYMSAYFPISLSTYPNLFLPWLISLLLILIADIALRIRSKSKSNLLNAIVKINFQ